MAIEIKELIVKISIVDKKDQSAMPVAVSQEITPSLKVQIIEECIEKIKEELRTNFER